MTYLFQRLLRAIRTHTRAFVHTLGANTAAGRYNPSNASPYYNEHHKVRPRKVLNSHASFLDSRQTVFLPYLLRRVLSGRGREGADKTEHATNPALVPWKKTWNPRHFAANSNARKERKACISLFLL